MRNKSKHFASIINRHMHVYSIVEYKRTAVPGWEWDDWSQQYYWGTVYETREVKHTLITREPIWWLTRRGETKYTCGCAFGSSFSHPDERITKVW